METKTRHTAQPQRVILKPGREAALQRQHPWLFSGGIARVQGDPELGAAVPVYSADGDFLAWGHYSPHSQIRARLFSWDADAAIDTPEFWRQRLQRALAARATLLAAGRTNACRLVYAESDGIPGLIVDRYADAVVVQFLTAGMTARRELFTELLWELLAPRTLYERSDADVLQKEGLSSRTGLLRGAPLAGPIEILENGLRFFVDLESGHKTGFYLDQRPNRQRLADTAAASAQSGHAPSLLNVFAYTGSFGVYGMAHGAETLVNIDTSTEALALGRENLAANGLEGAVEDIADNAFGVLRALREEGRRFDIIVLDPPKFAFSQKDVHKASRGYKDINLQALHLLNPGGVLFTFSCSGAISSELFQKIVFGAALDTGRHTQIIGWLNQGCDHPVALTFPESAYLKGLICRVADHRGQL